MESPWPHHRHLPNPSSRKRAIEELIRGRELAYTLQLALQRSLQLAAHEEEDLVAKILHSFTETLSIIDSTESDEISQFPAVVNSHCLDARKSEEDSSEICKPSATFKERRGCYKRRKTSDAWSKETSSLVDDGHAWRKYGQKAILNTQYPRNYFRCTHKFDQGCQATKQVQMIQENPPIYRTTYHGRHTCKSLLKAPQIILDTTARNSSVLLNFDQSIKQNSTNENRHNDSSMAVFPLTKQENREEPHSLLNSSSLCEYFLSPDLTGPMSIALSAGSDHGDVISSGVYSCSASTHDSLGMDLVVGSMDNLDDVLQFEF